MNAYAKMIAVCAVLVALTAVLWPESAGSPEERAALAEGRIVVTYWDRHFGHEHQSRVDLIEEYNRTQGVKDGVYVRAVPIGYYALMEKMLTSIAAGSPPDLCSLDTPILAQLASQGSITPLGDWMKTVPALAEERFFPHTWEMVEFTGYDAANQAYREDVWAVPSNTDVYCLLWNKDAFRRAGLDPERPPETLEELEEFAAKLTIVGPAGVEQVGFLPWFPWDLTYMWGGVFGGSWYDESAGLATCASDANIIASYAWQARFSIDPTRNEQLPFALDPSKVQSYAALGSYQSASNPFYSGKVAMITEGEWQATFIPKYAPNLDWGVAPLPHPEGKPAVAYGPACVVDAMPAGAPHKEAALKYLAWFFSPRPETGISPVSDYNAAIHNIPPRHEEALQDRFMDDPKFRVFVQQLFDKPVVRFMVSPEAQYYLDLIASMREYVVFRQRTPEQAVAELEATVNAKLRQTYAIMERTAQ